MQGQRHYWHPCPVPRAETSTICIREALSGQGPSSSHCFIPWRLWHWILASFHIDSVPFLLSESPRTEFLMETWRDRIFTLKEVNILQLWVISSIRNWMWNCASDLSVHGFFFFLGEFLAYGHAYYFHSHIPRFWKELTYLARNFYSGFISWPNHSNNLP